MQRGSCSLLTFVSRAQPHTWSHTTTLRRKALWGQSTVVFRDLNIRERDSQRGKDKYNIGNRMLGCFIGPPCRVVQSKRNKEELMKAEQWGWDTASRALHVRQSYSLLIECLLHLEIKRFLFHETFYYVDRLVRKLFSKSATEHLHGIEEIRSCQQSVLTQCSQEAFLVSVQLGSPNQRLPIFLPCDPLKRRST